MSYYLLKPCKSTPAFISTLKRAARLDLDASRDRLVEAGFPVEDIKVMLLLNDEPEATLYQSGKVLVKTENEDAARSRVDAIYRAIGLPQSRSS